LRQDLLLLTASLLAATLLWSGAVKIQRPFRAAIALTRFGITAVVRRSYGQVLGAVELAVAAMLIAWPSSWVPPALAGALFCGFAAATALALRRGERFECACFGGSSQISARTVLRALGLGGVAAAVAVAGPGTLEGTGLAEQLTALVTAALVLATIAIVSLMSSNRPFDRSLRTGE
jgi:hypothetical protein